MDFEYACNDEMAGMAHQGIQNTQVPVMDPKLSHHSMLVHLQTRLLYNRCVTAD